MECPVCHGTNVYGAARCGRCGAPLNADTLDPGELPDPTHPDAHQRPWEPDATTADPEPWNPAAAEPARPWEPELPTVPAPQGAWEPAGERPWEPDRTQMQPDPWAPASGWGQGEQWRYDQDIPGAVVPPPEPWQAPPAPKRRRNRTAQALIAAWIIVVAAAIAAVAIAFWPQGKPKAKATPLAGSATPAASSAATQATDTTSSADAAKTQASAVDSVLSSMAASRSELGSAMSDAGQCADLDTAVPALRKVVSERSTELDSAKALQVDALTNGDKLKDALTRALQGSLDADNHFLTWAQDSQGCSGATPQNSDFTQGSDLSINTAQPAKIEFLGYWAPIAQQQGLDPRDRDHI